LQQQLIVFIFIFLKLFFIILNSFDVLMLKINLKNKKNNIYFLKILFKTITTIISKKIALYIIVQPIKYHLFWPAWPHGRP